jgi:hypothetical protein
MDVRLRDLGSPNETRTFNKGRYDVFRIGGQTIGRSTFEPGWKWSRDNGPAMGLKLCPLEHVGLVLAGICAVGFEDGRVIELRAGQFFHVPAEPHDSWVVGEQQYVALHFLSAEAHMSAAPRK